MSINLPDQKYRIIKEIGRGGQGCVYLAENTRLATLWALKRIRKDSDPAGQMSEINILKNLDHPALPKVVDLLEDDEYYYMVFEYIEGATLYDELAWVGSFEPATVAGWLKELCDVLEYLHSREPFPVIYRDLKPSNIILSGSGKLKLVDFGSALEMRGDGRHACETVNMGTIGYAPPEQLNNGRKGVAGDFYSLGVLAFHLLTGIGPSANVYGGKSMTFYNPRVPETLCDIVERCMRLDPDQRYKSAADIRQALEKWDRSPATDEKSLNQFKRSTAGGKRAIMYKSTVISVLDSREFACELAYCAAGITGMKVLLLDTGTYSGSVEGYFNVKHQMVSETADDYDAEPGRVWGMKNFYIASVRHLIKKENIKELVDGYYSHFDLVVINLGRLVTPAEAAMFIKESAACVCALKGSLADIREFGEYAAYLSSAYGISQDKLKITFYDYKKDVHMPLGRLRELLGDEMVLGSVAYSKQREECRNSFECFAAQAFKTIRPDYFEIMRRLGIASEGVAIYG